MIRDKYERILMNFERRHPHLYNQAVEWWGSGRISIFVELNDGTVIDYNDIDNTIRWVTVGGDIDDETKCKAFGHNLQKFVMVSGMSKGEIAEKLGITNAMLSRYLHGKSMPSFDKGRQIANLMGCMMEELFDESYLK
jgi:DNA-binding XRE family transcriptional regulator